MKQQVDAIHLSAAEFGRVFGISERRVRELRDQGTIPSTEGGRFNLVAAGQALAASMRLVSGRAAAGGAEAAEGLDEARARLARAQADGQAMKNAATRGELVPLSEVTAAVVGMIEVAKAKLKRVPGKVAPSDAKLKARIGDAINDALIDLSSARAVPPAPTVADEPAGYACRCRPPRPSLGYVPRPPSCARRATRTRRGWWTGSTPTRTGLRRAIRLTGCWVWPGRPGAVRGGLRRRGSAGTRHCGGCGRTPSPGWA